MLEVEDGLLSGASLKAAESIAIETVFRTGRPTDGRGHSSHYGEEMRQCLTYRMILEEGDTRVTIRIPMVTTLDAKGSLTTNGQGDNSQDGMISHQ